MEAGLYKKNKIGVIIQARMSSTRMPGKILQRLPFGNGKPILHHIVDIVKDVQNVSFICIATSCSKENDAIEDSFKGADVVVFRGDEQDVLSRYATISKKHNLDQVIRLTGDNPILDKNILSDLIDFHLDNNYDHSSTAMLPLGTNISMFSSKALEEAHLNASKDSEKEHVEPWILASSKFSKGKLLYSKYKEIKDVRLTIDYPSDYAFLNIIFNHFKNTEVNIGIESVYKLLEKNAWLKEINNRNYQKKVYDNSEEEIKDAILVLETLELSSAVRLLKK
ncbi:cytidylyltransferase domain-containing protein [Aquimarina sp. LLG6339-5]|uniref:cytidylyltransferase domain-containing protein n=1 Tax=Aquimarina sp. LLG6339-5 TaxID=3160830 RepID=UPI0038687924